MIIVADSNGKALNADQLKPGAEVRKKVRYNLTEAKRLTPKVTNPQEIDDVVFQLGINDFNDGLREEEIVQKLFDVQVQYKRLFPNARQHVTAIPPLSKEHMQVNKGLQKLCNNHECNFISAKPFMDHASGKFRANLMRSDNLHYNDIGIRHLAKGIKKSLFSSSNLHSHQLSRIVNMRDGIPTQ